MEVAVAGDWIKVEKATIDKPEVRFIARVCKVSQAEAFAAWFRVWCWLDAETETGILPFMTPQDCDDIGRLPGLGHALSTNGGCGWIEFTAEGGAKVINFDRHNGQSAKRRALDMNRKRASRAQE